MEAVKVSDPGFGGILPKVAIAGRPRGLIAASVKAAKRRFRRVAFLVLPVFRACPARCAFAARPLGLAGVSGLPCPRCADVAAYGFKADFAYSPKGLKLAVADMSCRSSLMSRF
jgi:hypothetical protein